MESSPGSNVAGSKLSALANEFIPKQYITEDACLYLSQTLDYLHTDPGELNCVLTDLLAQFMIYLDDSVTLEILIDTLIKKCIQIDNFQYLGSQCSVYLCNTVIKSNLEKTFHTIFLNKCNMMFKEYVNASCTKPFRTNFTLFIAELTMFLKMPDGKHYQILIKATIDLLETLLELISDDTFKCLQQVIKMTGFTLQDEEPELYSKFMLKVKHYIESGKLNQKHKDILMGIISRKKIDGLSSDELNDVLDLENNDATRGYCSYDICHEVTVFGQDSQQYVVANEDAEPEIFEDYELFVSENEPQMDAYAEEEYDNYLQQLINK